MIKKIIPLVLLMALLVAPLTAFAKNGMSGRWWKNERTAELIKLTETEEYKLEDKFIESRRQRIRLKADVEKEQFELEVLLDKGADEKAILKQYKKVEAVSNALKEEGFKFLIDTRNIIGNDRFNQLKESAKQYRRNNKRGGKGMRQGTGGPQGFGNKSGYPCPVGRQGGQIVESQDIE